MRYVGSKNRIAREIIPIIQGYIDQTQATVYIEPFVGGANVIDKIDCQTRLGYDAEPYVIATLQALQSGWLPPKVITETDYKDIRDNKEKYAPELVGYCGYQLSFGSKFFGGYRRDKIGKRDYSKEAYNLVTSQIPKLKDIKFDVKDYREIESVEGAVIYCDPPYMGTGKYTATGNFNYEEFYDWCKKMSNKNIVLVSEYWMPSGYFKEIWSKQIKICLDSNRKEGKQRIERLFITV